MIPSIYIKILYLISAMLFIPGIKMLGKADTARRGNIISSIGMLLAVITAVVSNTEISLKWIMISMVLGALVGGIAARRVAMTSMPKMVALFNGFGGIASLLVSWAEYQKNVSLDEIASVHPLQLLIIVLTVVIGGITFTGSLVAWGKLSGRLTTKPILYPMQKAINSLIMFGLIVLSLVFAFMNIIEISSGYTIFIIVGIISLLIGVLLTIPIGGGDMPVVISLLNSFSGVAACAAGFVISNIVLIVAGALVGSSGIILTHIMCRSMNRSLKNVLFSGFGANSKSKKGDDVQGEVNPVSIEDAYLMLEAADSVLFVPGYGMATAQAQHVVCELAMHLEENGKEVNFAIHPVAGRMPGHMNVLLAEANVSYDQLKEMEDVNPNIENVDVCIIIGANDIVNPSARSDESSPIYGMPIIDVDKSKTVIVLKRSMGHGFSGIENPLFFNENTCMLFGDAKKSLQGLIAEFKE